MHIRRRGKHSYQCIVKIKQLTFAKTFSNLEEAKLWGYEEELKKLSKKNYKPTKKVILRHLLEDYLNDFVPFLKDKGIKNQIHRIINKYPWLVNKKIDELLPIDFQKYKLERVHDCGNIYSHKNNFRATNKDLILLKTIFNKAKNIWNYNLDNPLKGVTKFPESQGKYRPITGLEHKILLKVDKGIKRAIFLLLRHTGARPNEIFNLKWSHLYEEKDEIFIPWDISKSNYGRKIKVRPFLIKWLKKNLEKSKPKVINFNKESFRIWMSRFTKRKGISNLTMYDYRRNFVQYHANRNMPLPMLALMTGHKSYGLLARYYGHYTLRGGI